MNAWATDAPAAPTDLAPCDFFLSLKQHRSTAQRILTGKLVEKKTIKRKTNSALFIKIKSGLEWLKFETVTAV